MIQRLFENEAIVAVDKPCAWLTTPAREATDPRPVLGRELEKELGLRLWPVHRLDFEVSGLVLFAKNADAHRASQGWFESGLVVKTYSAWSATTVAGAAAGAGEWLEWRSVLVRGKRRTFEAAHGKDSLTRARVVRVGQICEWELQPMTGRPHQLRFEMAKHRAPILGDTLYGGHAWRGESEIALRAVLLDFSRIENRLGLPETLVAPPLK